MIYPQEELSHKSGKKGSPSRGIIGSPQI